MVRYIFKKNFSKIGCSGKKNFRGVGVLKMNNLTYLFHNIIKINLLGFNNNGQFSKYKLLDRRREIVNDCMSRTKTIVCDSHVQSMYAVAALLRMQSQWYTVVDDQRWAQDKIFCPVLLPTFVLAGGRTGQKPKTRPILQDRTPGPPVLCSALIQTLSSLTKNNCTVIWYTAK